MAEPSLLNAAVTIGFGALAGGITNAVAIWMLFHPYDERGIWRFKLQGAIPKNKQRLSKTIGRTVGQRLITSEDIAKNLASPELRAAFESAVQDLVSKFLQQDRGSLRSELPPTLLSELERGLTAAAPEITDRIVKHAATAEFRETVANFLVRAKSDFSETRVGEIITAERRSAITETIEEWLDGTVANPNFETTIEHWLDRQAVHLAGDTTPMLERLPQGLVDAVENSLANYLPEALDRLAGLLGDSESRKRIQSALHDLFSKFANDLLVHERIVARFVVTERTIARLLDNFEKQGADQVAKLLDQPEMRAQVAKTVNQALISFLKQPIADHIAALGTERVEEIKKTVLQHIVAALRDERTRSYVAERVDHSLQQLEEKPISELLEQLPPDRTANVISDVVSAPLTRSWIEGALHSAFTGILEQPIGKPAEWLGEERIDRITPALSSVLWDWTQAQVPEVISQIDVSGMVEAKVMGFSLERIEQLVRATTQRELDLIIRLGYVLGGIVGAAAYSLTLLFR